MSTTEWIFFIAKITAELSAILISFVAVAICYFLWQIAKEVYSLRREVDKLKEVKNESQQTIHQIKP